MFEYDYNYYDDNNEVRMIFKQDKFGILECPAILDLLFSYFQICQTILETKTVVLKFHFYSRQACGGDEANSVATTRTGT